MNTQKGFAPILLILLGLVVIGGGVYFYTNSYQKNEEINVEDKIETSATTSEQKKTVNNEVYITMVSKNNITLSDGFTLSVNDFPDDIQVSVQSSFGSSEEIKGAKISPDGKWIAVAVSGAAHDFGWIYELSTKKLSLVAFQYGGSVSVKEWRNNNEVVLELGSPKPSIREKVINVNNIPQYPTDEILIKENVKPFVSVGDKLGSMTVKSVEPFNSGQYSDNSKFTNLSPNNVKLKLSGPIIITGMYYFFVSDLGFSGYCMSDFDEGSIEKLPSLSLIDKTKFFCFRNEDFVETKLTKNQEKTKVTVKIDNFEMNRYPSEVVDWADLKEVFHIR